MDLLDRYLAAVAAQLPADQRTDIVDELKDLILSRFEAKEEALGRPLTEDEQEDILREIGHPLIVAARYRKGPDALIGRELFPYWLWGVKSALLALAAVHALLFLIALAGGDGNFGQNFGQAFAQTWNGFFSRAFTIIGAVTVIGAVFEHYGVRPRWLTRWRVRDLSTFNLSDPLAWKAALGASATKAKRRRRRPASQWPGAEHLFSFIATGLFVLWWLGLVHFPFAQVIGAGAELRPAPIWAALYGPILAYAVACMAADLFGVARPGAVRLQAGAQTVLAAAGLGLTAAIWNAGHWFDLVSGDRTERIGADVGFLTMEGLRAMRAAGGEDLTLWAANLSGVFTWIVAIAALSLGFKLLMSLVRLVRPA